ncbi:MAG TPA: hypothetical protein VNA88_10200 [Candidatus Kapabacteria bacterium]|nr:hypothetical protein [Candidatus Kapabacteria bacterium]
MKLRTFVLRGLPALLLAAAMIAAPVDADARSKGKKGSKKEEKGGKPELQRVPTNPFESIVNRISNIRFFSTNYGIFGHDVERSEAGGFWPRSNPKAYIYGGGIWFGAQKVVDGQRKNISVIGYDPNSGISWFTPGRIDDDTEDANKYRIYFSTDYNPFTGEPNDPADDRANGVNWPLWDTSPGDTVKYSRYFGFYVDDTTQRNRETFPKGPAMISQEDVFTTYSDKDISRFAGQDEVGHPLRVQIEQTIYSWGFGTRQDDPKTPARDITSPYQDMIFLKYVLVNRSTDTLYDCYMAPAMDMDIGAAGNDRAKIAIERKEDDTLNLAVQWSEAEATGYGYIGFDFLESPAVDATGRVRSDKRVFTEAEQVGLTTFQNWRIEEDPTASGERYEFMAAGDRDGDDAAGDKRFLMATGPFTLAPGDTARVVVGLVFAWAQSGGTPTGTWDDLEKLLRVDEFAQTVYNNNFLAPIPPDPARLSWRPLDGGVELSWDETSERSLDIVERGLDFAGYLVQRRRIASPKFTPTDTLEGWNIGWKTIGRIDLPPLPTEDQRYLAARTGNLGVLGPWWRLPMLADTCAARGFVRVDTVRNIDTIKRPGMADSLVVSRFGRLVNRYCFEFDPNDDRAFVSLQYIFDSLGRADLVNRYRNGFGGQFSSLLDTTIREVVRDAIVAIVDSITGGHRFVDVGDDNGNNRIETNEVNLTQNERLLNNVDYYYRLLAFDAGDPLGGTQPKLNAGVLGINEIKATPEAPPPTRAGADPIVIMGDGLGGISNFQFMVLDQERLGQLFGGDTLEFEFRPVDLYPLPASYFPQMAAFYMNQVIVRRRSTGEVINRFIVPYLVGGLLKFSDRQDVLDTNLRTGLHAINETIDPTDSIWISAKGVQVPYAGTFAADPNQNWFGTSAIYKATFGIAFDFNFTQFGDSLRFGRFGDTTTRDNPFTRVGSSNTNLVPRAQYLGVTSTASTPYTAIPSAGQVKPEVTFLPGGVQPEIKFEKQGRTYTFRDVPYLTIDVKNVNTYTRQVIDPNTGQTTTQTITYNATIPADPNASIYADTAKTADVLIRLIDPGYHGLFAYGWIKLDSMTDAQRTSLIQRARFTAQSPVRPVETTIPGRYYVGTVNGTDDLGNPVTLTFTHRLVVNGADVLLDFAGMASVEPPFLPKHLPATRPTQDFAAGDKVTIDFTGGTLGLPQPGAKVLVAIPDPKPEIISAETGRNYSDEMLEQIRIVPNPYLVSHIGQRANSESVLYFTRLPERCTIEIYTEAGEQLTVIEHESTPDGRRAVNAWDLISKAGRKTASQLLIARIVTPNGAETIKKFSIVVGGFRIVGG